MQKTTYIGTVLKESAKIIFCQVGAVKSQRKLSQLLEHLQFAVNHHVLGPGGPRLVCDALLNSDKLSYKNPDHWVLSFKLVSRFLKKSDEKVPVGCSF